MSKGTFESPLDRLTALQGQQAKGKRKPGGKVRQTVYMKQALKDRVQEIAEAEGLGVTEMFRWLIDTGLDAYNNGERPQVETKTVKVLQYRHKDSGVTGDE